MIHSHDPKITTLQPCQMSVLDPGSLPLLPPDGGLLSSGPIGNSDGGGKFHRNGDSLVSPGRGLLSVVNRIKGGLHDVPDIPEELESGGDELQSGGLLGDVASGDEGEEG